MENEPDSSEDPRTAATKMVLVKFPVPLLQEMDALCRFNGVDRSEFIISAASQLLDYLDRKVGAPSPRQADDSYGDWDDEIISAADNVDSEDEP